jgi:hypothetical protein
LIRVEDPQPNADAPPPSTRAQAPQSASSSELSLIVELHRAGDDALLRVISLLHRRRCRVMAAQFSAPPDAPGQLALRVLAPPAHVGRIEHWLGSLVDVRGVARLQP